MKKAAFLGLMFALTVAAFAQVVREPATKTPVATKVPSLPELEKMTARFAPIELRVDTSGLNAGDKAAIAKLIEASRIVDQIQLDQRWKGNEALYTKLTKETSALGKAQLHYFWINKG